MARRMHGKTAPPAADFQHVVGRTQSQFAAQHVVFSHLRLLERHPRPVPVGRGIRHGRIKPQGEELVAQVVVLADVPAAGAQAVRTQPVRHAVREIHQADPPVRFPRPLQHRRVIRVADEPGNHRDQIPRLPQAIHVSLTEPHRPAEHARAEKGRIFDPDVRPRFPAQPAKYLFAAVRHRDAQTAPLHAGEGGEQNRSVIHRELASLRAYLSRRKPLCAV
jgi:hypothetical protein